LLANIKTVVHDLPTYGYRRVWGVLRHQGIEGHEPIIANPKRVYRVMRDHNLLLYRHGHRRVDTRKHEGTVAVKATVTLAGVRMALSWPATMVKKFGSLLPWIAVTGK